MWSVEHSVEAPVPASAVWACYRDVDRWSEWNGAVESVTLTSPFAAGASGTMTPPHQGPLPFRVIEAAEDEGYVSETDIAETVTLRMRCRLEPVATGTRVVHRAELDGPAADYFADSFGAALAAGVPKTLAALVDRVTGGGERPEKHALLVLTSTAELGDTGRPTGAYASEVAEAWQVFRDAGYAVELASTAGGRPPLEAVNDQHPVQRAFLTDPDMSRRLADTPRAADVDAGRYEVVFVAGGHGAVWDLPTDTGLAALLREAYQGGSVVATVCHGAAALLNVTRSDGRYLIEGKRLTAFTNDEERAVGMTGVVPFLLAEALAERGAIYEEKPPFLPHVVADARLVTGQNPASATAVAEAALAEIAAGDDASRGIKPVVEPVDATA